jgi:hypothetical protein
MKPLARFTRDQSSRLISATRKPAKRADGEERPHVRRGHFKQHPQFIGRENANRPACILHALRGNGGIEFCEMPLHREIEQTHGFPSEVVPCLAG